MTLAPILKVAHLSYRYPTGHIALCDVNFVVGVNEIVGLVGPNGAGKTTLLLHLNGLLHGSRVTPRDGDTAGALGGFVGAAICPCPRANGRRHNPANTNEKGAILSKNRIFKRPDFLVVRRTFDLLPCLTATAYRVL